jgi:hypothetical protein
MCHMTWIYQTYDRSQLSTRSRWVLTVISLPCHGRLGHWHDPWKRVPDHGPDRHTDTYPAAQRWAARAWAARARLLAARGGGTAANRGPPQPLPASTWRRLASRSECFKLACRMSDSDRAETNGLGFDFINGKKARFVSLGCIQCNHQRMDRKLTRYRLDSILV